MRQAIVTKYLCPTNFRGARVKATAAAGSVTVNWKHEHGPEANHRLAAMALVDKYEWREHYDRLCGGQMADGRYCFVMVSEGFQESHEDRSAREGYDDVESRFAR